MIIIIINEFSNENINTWYFYCVTIGKTVFPGLKVKLILITWRCPVRSPGPSVVLLSLVRSPGPSVVLCVNYYQ